LKHINVYSACTILNSIKSILTNLKLHNNNYVTLWRFFNMATKEKKEVRLGNSDVFVSFESETAVPDTTTDAGPDQIKLHEDAQKPEKDPSAEYDAAEHVDTPEDVERANESTFYGIILKHRSTEAFAKAKVSFSK
jgi:pyruvate/2-oxoacid:ferredoxin oxidoreductase beta subunit